jgi:hypothetical protein
LPLQLAGDAALLHHMRQLVRQEPLAVPIAVYFDNSLIQK